MPKDSSFPIPGDNVRLPEAITIQHGPAPVLSRLFIAADNMARAIGVEMKFRNDFQELMKLNEAEVAKGTWYALHDMFNPRLAVDLNRGNAFWIAAEDASGAIVATVCGRVYDWTDTTLADEVRLMLYGGRDIGQKCIVTAPLASEITGIVYYAGGVWVAKEYRGTGLATLLPHVARAYAVGRWPLDCAMNMIKTSTLGSSHPTKYGYSEMSYSITVPGYHGDDVEAVVCRLKPDEMYADFARFAEDWRAYARVRQAA